MESMDKALDFLRQHTDVVLATSDDNVPDIRVFRIMKIDGTTLYFSTSAAKRIYSQLLRNAQVAVMASSGNVFVKCTGKVTFDVDTDTAQWIFAHDKDLARLYTSYDSLVYFRLDVQQMDYYDLTPTPPVMVHYDLTDNTTGSGYVGEKYAGKKNYVLQKAEAIDVDEVFALYVARVEWMDRMDIRQWNVTDYLTRFPKPYYEQQCSEGHLYVLREMEGQRILGAMVLLTEDARWEGMPATPALYVHNLVTLPDAKGAGRYMLRCAEQMVQQRGMKLLRLDCAVNNPVLNRYYASQGYRPVGICRDGAYHGILVEKQL